MTHMTCPASGVSSAGTLVAEIIQMMTAFQRSHCPKLALCIAAQLDCLCRHPDADEVVRETADNMHDEWQITARSFERGADHIADGRVTSAPGKQGDHEENNL